MNYRARVRTARHHRAKQADLLRIERHAKRCDWIKSEHPSKAFGPLQQHTRRDNAARGMGREVTEGYSQLIKRRQHVKRVLAHGIVGKIGRRRRSVAFPAAAPVDADHAQAARKQRGSEFDPVLAGEIAVDEDDGYLAFSPFPPAELDLARTHPRHRRPSPRPSLFSPPPPAPPAPHSAT